MLNVEKNSCEAILATLVDDAAQRGYLAALDYSTAFDRMDPRISKEVLEQLNFNKRAFQLIIRQWSQTKTWI